MRFPQMVLEGCYMLKVQIRGRILFKSLHKSKSKEDLRFETLNGLIHGVQDDSNTIQLKMVPKEDHDLINVIKAIDWTNQASLSEGLGHVT